MKLAPALSGKAIVLLSCVVGIQAFTFTTTSVTPRRHHVLRSTPVEKGGETSLPVIPKLGDKSRTVGFTSEEMKELTDFKTEIADAPGGGKDLQVVVLPSWQHHPVQWDPLCAALGELELPTTVLETPDNMWAYALRGLGHRRMVMAEERGLGDVQVTESLQPVFRFFSEALNELVGGEKRKELVVLTNDDSTWMFKAFLNSRAGGKWLDEGKSHIQSVIYLGGLKVGDTGEVALKVYPGEHLEPPKPAAGEMLEYGRGAPSEEEHVDPKVEPLKREATRFFDLTATGEFDPYVDTLSCVQTDGEDETCMLPNFEEQGQVAWLGSVRMIKLWLPKVIGMVR